jgi:hypothetical protein
METRVDERHSSPRASDRSTTSYHRQTLS